MRRRTGTRHTTERRMIWRHYLSVRVASRNVESRTRLIGLQRPRKIQHREPARSVPDRLIQERRLGCRFALQAATAPASADQSAARPPAPSVRCAVARNSSRLPRSMPTSSTIRVVCGFQSFFEAISLNETTMITAAVSYFEGIRSPSVTRTSRDEDSRIPRSNRSREH